jgi:O-antigen/teichoic acid export membrane protein
VSPPTDAAGPAVRPPEAGGAAPAVEHASEVTRRTARAGAALAARQVLVQGSNVLGGILLANLLTPAEFGIYGVFVFFLTFLIAFGDVGLGASLVRQPAEPSTEDMRSVFTVQQALVAVAVAGAWLAAPAIAAWYERPPGEAWLFRLAALSLLFTSLQSIAAIRLERRLAFDRLAVAEVAQALAFNGIAVVLAWRGAGALGVAVALLARSVVGAVLTNLISPWPLGWRWDWPRVRAHLRFGLPYQGGNFVSLAKDSITPLLVGALLGAAEVGYVNWAQMVAAYPVLLLMILQRLYLPAFSRMQHHPEALGPFVERILRTTHSLCAPLAVLSLALAVPGTRLLFGDKWLAALPVFYLCWVANLFVPTAGPLAALLNALGHSGLVFRFAVLWAVGTWALGGPAIVWLGTLGYGVANVGVQLTNLLLFRAVRRRVRFRVLPAMLPPWGAALVAGAAVAAAAAAWPPSSIPALAAYAAAGLLLYAPGLALLAPGDARRAGAWLRTRLYAR